MCLNQGYSQLMRVVRLTAAILLLDAGWDLDLAAQQDKVGRRVLEERKAQATNGDAEAQHNLA
jgi:hypothetical protein